MIFAFLFVNEIEKTEIATNYEFNSAKKNIRANQTLINIIFNS